MADGHPDPYKLRFIELGNEQYNSNYLEQVRRVACGAWGPHCWHPFLPLGVEPCDVYPFK